MFLMKSHFLFSTLASIGILMFISMPVRAAEDAGVPLALAHNKRQIIDLDCRHHLLPKDARIQGARALDQEKMLLAAVKGKLFPKSPLQSLGWMDMVIRAYGFNGSLSQIQEGPGQKAVLRLSTLVGNDYVVAAQMAYGIHMRQGILDASYAPYLGQMIMTLTESDPGMETLKINALIDEATTLLEGVSPAVKAYGRWALRAYAYDDMIAADVAMMGVCASSPKPDELTKLGKAIRLSQFDPKRD